MSSLSPLIRSTLRRGASCGHRLPNTPTSTTSGMIIRCLNNQLVWPPPQMKLEGKDQVQILFEKILFLDLVEVSMLNHLVQTRLGASGGNMSGLGQLEGGQAAAAAAPVEPAEEKTVFDIKLVSFDAKAKIKIIKEVRALAGLGLKEAKELVEGAPKVIQKGVKKEAAEEVKKLLEGIGATIEIA